MLCDQHPVASLGKNMGRGYTTLIRIVGLGIELIVAAYDRRRRLAIYIYIYISVRELTELLLPNRGNLLLSWPPSQPNGELAGLTKTYGTRMSWHSAPLAVATTDGFISDQAVCGFLPLTPAVGRFATGVWSNALQYVYLCTHTK